MKEKIQRSLMKAITRRIIASLTTMIIVYMFTKELLLSTGVWLVEFIIKMVIYYIHERAWNGINYWKVDTNF